MFLESVATVKCQDNLDRTYIYNDRRGEVYFSGVVWVNISQMIALEKIRRIALFELHYLKK
jgi:hypothetical protein